MSLKMIFLIFAISFLEITTIDTSYILEHKNLTIKIDKAECTSKFLLKFTLGNVSKTPETNITFFPKVISPTNYNGTYCECIINKLTDTKEITPVTCSLDISGYGISSTDEIKLESTTKGIKYFNSATNEDVEKTDTTIYLNSTSPSSTNKASLFPISFAATQTCSPFSLDISGQTVSQFVSCNAYNYEFQLNYQPLKSLPTIEYQFTIPLLYPSLHDEAICTLSNKENSYIQCKIDVEKIAGTPSTNIIFNADTLTLINKTTSNNTKATIKYGGVNGGLFIGYCPYKQESAIGGYENLIDKYKLDNPQLQKLNTSPKCNNGYYSFLAYPLNENLAISGNSQPYFIFNSTGTYKDAILCSLITQDTPEKAIKCYTKSKILKGQTINWVGEDHTKGVAVAITHPKGELVASTYCGYTFDLGELLSYPSLEPSYCLLDYVFFYLEFQNEIKEYPSKEEIVDFDIPITDSAGKYKTATCSLPTDEGKKSISCKIDLLSGGSGSETIKKDTVITLSNIDGVKLGDSGNKVTFKIGEKNNFKLSANCNQMTSNDGYGLRIVEFISGAADLTNKIYKFSIGKSYYKKVEGNDLNDNSKFNLKLSSPSGFKGQSASCTYPNENDTLINCELSLTKFRLSNEDEIGWERQSTKILEPIDNNQNKEHDLYITAGSGIVKIDQNVGDYELTLELNDASISSMECKALEFSFEITGYKFVNDLTITEDLYFEIPFSINKGTNEATTDKKPKCSYDSSTKKIKCLVDLSDDNNNSLNKGTFIKITNKEISQETDAENILIKDKDQNEVGKLGVNGVIFTKLEAACGGKPTYKLASLELTDNILTTTTCSYGVLSLSLGKPTESESIEENKIISYSLPLEIGQNSETAQCIFSKGQPISCKLNSFNKISKDSTLSWKGTSALTNITDEIVSFPEHYQSKIDLKDSTPNAVDYCLLYNLGEFSVNKNYTCDSENELLSFDLVFKSAIKIDTISGFDIEVRINGTSIDTATCTLPNYDLDFKNVTCNIKLKKTTTDQTPKTELFVIDKDAKVEILGFKQTPLTYIGLSIDVPSNNNLFTLSKICSAKIDYQVETNIREYFYDNSKSPCLETETSSTFTFYLGIAENITKDSAFSNGITNEFDLDITSPEKLTAKCKSLTDSDYYEQIACNLDVTKYRINENDLISIPAQKKDISATKDTETTSKTLLIKGGEFNASAKCGNYNQDLKLKSGMTGSFKFDNVSSTNSNNTIKFSLENYYLDQYPKNNLTFNFNVTVKYTQENSLQWGVKKEATCTIPTSSDTEIKCYFNYENMHFRKKTIITYEKKEVSTTVKAEADEAANTKTEIYDVYDSDKKAVGQIILDSFKVDNNNNYISNELNENYGDFSKGITFNLKAGEITYDDNYQCSSDSSFDFYIGSLNESSPYIISTSTSTATQAQTYKFNLAMSINSAEFIPKCSINIDKKIKCSFDQNSIMTLRKDEIFIWDEQKIKIQTEENTESIIIDEETKKLNKTFIISIGQLKSIKTNIVKCSWGKINLGDVNSVTSGGCSNNDNKLIVYVNLVKNMLPFKYETNSFTLKYQKDEETDKGDCKCYLPNTASNKITCYIDIDDNALVKKGTKITITKDDTNSAVLQTEDKFIIELNKLGGENNNNNIYTLSSTCQGKMDLTFSNSLQHKTKDFCSSDENKKTFSYSFYLGILADQRSLEDFTLKITPSHLVCKCSFPNQANGFVNCSIDTSNYALVEGDIIQFEDTQIDVTDKLDSSSNPVKPKIVILGDSLKILSNEKCGRYKVNLGQSTNTPEISRKKFIDPYYYFNLKNVKITDDSLPSITLYFILNVELKKKSETTSTRRLDDVTIEKTANCTLKKRTETDTENEIDCVTNLFGNKFNVGDSISLAVTTTQDSAEVIKEIDLYDNIEDAYKSGTETEDSSNKIGTLILSTEVKNSKEEFKFSMDAEEEVIYSFDSLNITEDTEACSDGEYRFIIKDYKSAEKDQTKLKSGYFEFFPIFNDQPYQANCTIPNTITGDVSCTVILNNVQINKDQKIIWDSKSLKASNGFKILLPENLEGVFKVNTSCYQIDLGTVKEIELEDDWCQTTGINFIIKTEGSSTFSEISDEKFNLKLTTSKKTEITATCDIPVSTSDILYCNIPYNKGEMITNGDIFTLTEFLGNSKGNSISLTIPTSSTTISKEDLTFTLDSDCKFVDIEITSLTSSITAECQYPYNFTLATEAEIIADDITLEDIEFNIPLTNPDSKSLSCSLNKSSKTTTCIFDISSTTLTQGTKLTFAETSDIKNTNGGTIGIYLESGEISVPETCGPILQINSISLSSAVCSISSSTDTQVDENGIAYTYKMYFKYTASKLSTQKFDLKLKIEDSFTEQLDCSIESSSDTISCSYGLGGTEINEASSFSIKAQEIAPTNLNSGKIIIKNDLKTNLAVPCGHSIYDKSFSISSTELEYSCNKTDEVISLTGKIDENEQQLKNDLTFGLTLSSPQGTSLNCTIQQSTSTTDSNSNLVCKFKSTSDSSIAIDMQIITLDSYSLIIKNAIKQSLAGCKADIQEESSQSSESASSSTSTSSDTTTSASDVGSGKLIGINFIMIIIILNFIF